MRPRQASSVIVLAASSDAGAGETTTRGPGRRKQSSGEGMGSAGGGGSQAKKRSSATSTSSNKRAPSSGGAAPPPANSPVSDFGADFDDDPRAFAQLTEPELQGLPLLERLAASAGDGNTEGSEELFSAPVWAGRRGGYTPFEYVDFTEEDVLHEVQVRVRRPRAHVFEVWADRLNYGEWFSLLGQAVLHADAPELASYFIFYRWGRLPPLELYATLQRELGEEGESVLERSVDGWDLAVGAFFEDDGADDDGTASTLVTLRLGYALPAPLAEHVGSVGVYGHVEEILRADMLAMKAFIETGGGSDLEALRERRREEEAALAAQVQEERSKGADSVLVAASQAESQGLYDEEMAEYGGEGAGQEHEGDEEEGPFGSGGGGGGGSSGAGQKSRGGGSRRSKTAAAAVAP